MKGSKGLGRVKLRNWKRNVCGGVMETRLHQRPVGGEMMYIAKYTKVIGRSMKISNRTKQE